MLSRLRAIPHIKVSEHVLLSGCTRFAIGGPANLLIDASTEAGLAAVFAELREAGVPIALIGGGTNLVVSDEGFAGAVVRFTANRIEAAGSTIRVESGAVLQDLVDLGIDRGLGGLETMTGIPGWVGGAVYGNAGAYGHSIQERIESVRFFDGKEFREIGSPECGFAYRESVFKRCKNWIVTSAVLRLDPGDPAALRSSAEAILKIRNEKYPRSMRCAGSIFKNLILEQLPESVRAQVPSRVVREGKVPSAYFLESVGAKGMAIGGMRVADYHANLIYSLGSGSFSGGSSGGGSSSDLRKLIDVLKAKVLEAHGLTLEEEVQYLP